MSSALVREYEETRPKIKAELEHYRQRGLHASNQEIFEVMCLCICSPKTEYKAARSANEELKRRGLLLSGSPEEIALCLKKHKVRFHNRKAGYIVKARDEFLGDAAKISLRLILDVVRDDEPMERRRRLRELLRGVGLGWKETSEFLRNLGLGPDYAILDSRILKHLQRCRVITGIPKPLTKRKYLEVEEKMRKWSEKIGIPLDELDILLWH